MSKLTPKKFSKRQIEISKKLCRELDGWGFQHYVRHCMVPKYGDDTYAIEEWSNEDIADFIVTDLLKISNSSPKAPKGTADGGDKL